MADVLVEERSLQDVANAIREKNGEVTKYKPEQMGTAIRNLPTSDTPDFWDVYQDYGNRRKYDFAFSGSYWTNENFSKIKHDLIPTGCKGLFFNSNITGDMTELLKNMNIIIDFSKSVDIVSIFYNTRITRSATINATSAKRIETIGMYAEFLETIDEFIFGKKEDNQLYINVFIYMKRLKNIKISGDVIDDLNFAMSPNLTTESVDSIINALVDYTGQQTKTLKLNSSVVNRMTDEQHSKIFNKNWTTG